MDSRRLQLTLLLVGAVTALAVWQVRAMHRVSHTLPAALSKRWDRAAASAYLDEREVWWQEWPPAQLDHGTMCLSCHTAVPYAMARSALRAELKETRLAGPERFLLDSIEKRVSNWSTVAPYYTDAVDGPGMTEGSHATESVLNAVILASYDAQEGHVRPITRMALDEAWALQEKTGEMAGGWKWQNFHLAPWEAPESAYQGAAMLALAVGNAPDGYANEPEVRGHVDRLRDYLRREYARQPAMNKLYVLWASKQLPGLLNEAETDALIEKIQGLQRRDGGWRLASLDKQPGLKRAITETWKELDGRAESDGCATGLVVLAMVKSGMSPQEPTLKRGLEWLERHQDKEGKWRATSINGPRDPRSEVGRFMNDAATGYAVLALESTR